MRFAQIYLLHGLWFVAAFGLFLWWALQHRQKVTSRFVESRLLPEVAASFSSQRQMLKYVLLLIVVILSVLALARPQWGFSWEEVKREGLDIAVVIDTSKSMLTQDVRPNRLARCKLAVKDLLKKLKGDRIGLVAFAGDAFLVCPLTVDYSGFLLSLDDLNVNTIPRGGTDVSRAIRDAIRAYGNTPARYKAIIIMTDGENLEGDPVSAAEEAKKQGIKIFTIGIGTQEGEIIQVPMENGSFEFLKDEQDNFVKSRLNENLLQQIAIMTGGAYVRAGGAEFGLDMIYDQLSKMEKREIENKMQKKFHERFQIPLALALLALFAETLITTRRKIA